MIEQMRLNVSLHYIACVFISARASESVSFRTLTHDFSNMKTSWLMIFLGGKISDVARIIRYNQ
jgi:hypothetical protein